MISLRPTCVLGVSAARELITDVYRRDAENAEVAQRVGLGTVAVGLCTSSYATIRTTKTTSE